jgi:hypothetical protein
MSKSKKSKKFLCPSCGHIRGGRQINIQLGPEGGGGPVPFAGCCECLAKIVMQHKIFVTNQHCIVCGSAKVVTLFEGGERMECPLHVNARRLLGRAAHALDDEHPVGKEIRQILAGSNA